MLKDLIQKLAKEIHDEAVQNRRHLHMNPELSFEEHNTSSFIKSKLGEIGISWKPVAGTGVLAVIEGQPSDRVIALRADIDALPIQELNRTSYTSRNPGVMHACGHDFHTASLLGTAKILHQIRKEFKGTVKLLFQPAEEIIPGGAERMIKDGVLNDPRPDAIIGQHAMPRIEAGKIGIKRGKFMASNDKLLVRIKGRGGHGAQPHLNTDPVVIAANIVLALQQVISRRASPKEPSVLSFGKVTADGAYNIIPDEVTMEGTFRAMNETWRNEAHKIMVKMAEGVAEGMGGECEFTILKGYPFLINEEKLAEEIQHHAEEYLGPENVLAEEIWMAAEDFAHYSQIIDSCFYLCGVGNQTKGINSSLHSATFDIDEDALTTSTGLMAYLAVKRLDP
jgi:amidohydrolase